VVLVAKNPRYDPANPKAAPELVEGELPGATLSLAQRPLPSIRWFFMGGNTDQIGVRVYKWHVFSVPATQAAAAGSPVPAGATPPVGAAPASAPAIVERSGWAVENFSVGPVDSNGQEVTCYSSASGAVKPEQLTIDFSTGCTAVAVEMVLRITDTPQVTLTAAGSGASGRLVKDSLLLYYLDPTGALRTRWQEPDLVLAEMVATPAAAAATGPGVPGAPTTPAAGAPTGGKVTREEYERQMAERRRRDEEALRAQMEDVRRATEADQAERERHEREQFITPGF